MNRLVLKHNINQFCKTAELLNPQKKIFDPEGTFKLRFAHDDIGGMRKWISQAGYSPDDCINYAELVEDEVFIKAYEFPCILI